jgi:16S rRNA (uracil1498-N3)-methyltransferase
MTSHRFLFFSEEATASSSSVMLTGEEHHHFARALRFHVGDTIFATNGRGLILECRAATVGRTTTTAEVLSVVEECAPAREFVLAIGIIRKPKFEQAFEQCIELGITRCVPFVSQNSHQETYSERHFARLRKLAVGAIKQSFRSWLPQVAEPMPFDELVDAVRRTQHTFVGRQGADPPPSAPPDGDVAIVVGPEAGLTESEFAALEGAGAVFAGVSTHRLRSETAAVALVGALARRD